jgi:hypothetical protein
MPDRDDPTAERARRTRRAPPPVPDPALPPEPDADAWARAEAEAKAEAAALAPTAGWSPTTDHASPRCPYLEPAPTGSLDGFGSPGGLPGRATPALGGGPDRCAAVGDPAPLSERQRALVCLTAGHVECPRYLRATNEVPAFAPEAVEVVRSRPIATIAGAGAVIVAAAITVAFVVAGGGLSIAGPTDGPNPTGSNVAVVSPSAAPGDSTGPGVSEGPASPGPSPTVGHSPADSVAPSPTPSAAASVRPSPRPSSPGATPTPSSDRYALLVPCPDQPDCYIYTIRSGDNLFSIARYFGVPLEKVYDLNPWARTQGIQAGDELILPPPTR